MSAIHRELIDVDKVTADAICMAGHWAATNPGVDQDEAVSVATSAVETALRGESIQDVAAYVRVCVRNALRTLVKLQRRPMSRIESCDDPIAPESHGPSAAIEAEEFWTQAVRGLSDRERDAVLLVKRLELTQAEAAERMDCDEATVQRYIVRAEPILARNLRGYVE